MASPLNSALAALSSAFRRIGVGWYLFGAQAVALHGVPRFTADLDITVEEPPRGIGDFVEQLSAAGFDLAIEEEPAGFAAVARVLPFIHRKTGLPVDVVLAGRPKDVEDVEALIAEHTEAMDVAGVRARLAELEGALGQSDLLPLFERLREAACPGQ